MWRAWLKKHHTTAKEIWLVYYKKDSGKARVAYSDAVEEALCFGWIDSILKPINREKYAQRFTPRKPKSQWSEMNRERMRRLIAAKLMTPAGLAVYDAKDSNLKLNAARNSPAKVVLPKDILTELKKEKQTWKNFQKFPESYKRIRVWWIHAARKRPEVFRRRLRYFVKMTAQNERFGIVQ
jgi:uncharacterized protein YdeI (YjbR/CyaY-like superfamily)